ncbi:hypothetical protein BHE90_007475 [Fusarium euwallaceae]|uniref:Alpha-1,3-mannosyltransferase MNT3 n=1 Tax=Fusarium euwallaceae TaxID=1147111 RepID=A0A430LQT1_9HYPO|nr:hypothetical protein BHE90_007475 [Fusarium euwallaceae]
MFSKVGVLRLNTHALQITAAVAFIWLFVVLVYCYRDLSFSTPPSTNVSSSRPSSRPIQSSAPVAQTYEPIKLGAQYFLDYPLREPYKDIFGELGQRAQFLRLWIEQLEGVDGTSEEREEVVELLERLTKSLFPYLKREEGASPPLEAIQTRLGISQNEEGNLTATRRQAGIVIPTGENTLRFACHLVASLTRVHKTALPIQIVYAGDDDLSPAGRDKIQEAAGDVEVDMLDILTVFDDKTLKLAEGGWAIKPFAALASDFEKVILLDADAVFLQDPEQLFRQDRFQETGVLLFHDRLLWKGMFADRHNWWHEQLKHPSPETEKSLVWTEHYSEEGDSGIVVVDKTRLDVLIGLLHVGWQNSEAVRNEVTYKITYGDKESWWIGFEATGSKYSFSPHYGGIVGWLESTEQDEDNVDKSKREEEVRVCSFVIAHVDQTDKLLWYNGGLLKNKIVNQTDFEVPTHWMIDQTWYKGAAKKDMSCMAGDKATELSEDERGILARSIDVARDVDERLGLLS